MTGWTTSESRCPKGFAGSSPALTNRGEVVKLAATPEPKGMPSCRTSGHRTLLLIVCSELIGLD